MAVLLLTGCRRETEPPQWDVDLLGPLISSTFTVQDLSDGGEFTSDADGNLSVRYTSELFALRLDTVYDVPDTSFIYRYGLPFPGPFNVPQNTVFYDQTDVTRFDLNDLQLNTLWVRSGTLGVTLTSAVPGDCIGRFGLPAALLNGTPFQVELPVAAGTPSDPSQAFGQYPLNGHRIDLRGPGFNEVNTLSTAIQVRTAQGIGTTVLTDQDSLIAEIAYAGIVADYARGYFGQPAFSVGPSTEPLNIFSELQAGSFDLESSTARLVITNGIGADVQAFIQQLEVSNTGSGQSLSLQHALLGGPVNVSRAVDLNGGFQTTTYTAVMDDGNSNFTELLELIPDQVSYAADLQVNPLGDISNGNDFFYYDSELRAELVVDVPLRLIATGITLESTFDPDLPGTSEGHGLQEGELKLFADNGFPFEGTIQLEIVDTDENVLDVLPVTGTVAPALLGPDLLVQQRVASELQAHVSPAQTDLLYQGTRVRVRIIFSTSDQSQHLTLLDSYALDLQITLGANYIVNGDE